VDVGKGCDGEHGDLVDDVNVCGAEVGGEWWGRVVPSGLAMSDGNGVQGVDGVAIDESGGETGGSGCSDAVGQAPRAREGLEGLDAV